MLQHLCEEKPSASKIGFPGLIFLPHHLQLSVEYDVPWYTLPTLPPFSFIYVNDILMILGFYAYSISFSASAFFVFNFLEVLPNLVER